MAFYFCPNQTSISLIPAEFPGFLEFFRMISTFRNGISVLTLEARCGLLGASSTYPNGNEPFMSG
jgi:hypothetical protein